MRQYLIFSDLDGTLLDHHDYSFKDALPALKIIYHLNIPLIFNSSKTRDEIIEIRSALHNNDPFVVENGVAIFIPGGTFPGNSAEMRQILLSPARQKILNIIHQLRAQQGYAYKGFADYSVAELMRETGLSERQARQAKQRVGSEPIKWIGDEQSKFMFQQAIELQGLKLVKGGRFYHVMGQTDKAFAMSRLLTEYKKSYQQANHAKSQADFLTIALGDSQNDLLMLEQADIAGVIRPVNADPLKLNKNSNTIIESTLPAPMGWQQVMDKILNRIQMEQTL